MRPRPPADATLLSGLQSSLGTRLTSPLVSLERERNAGRATFPSEIVTCWLADGGKFQIFCKYGLVAQRPTGHGHRSGVTYEVQVYREVLTRLGRSTPTFLGAHYDTDTGCWWLLLEHIAGATRLSKSRASRMLEAARWIGEFHRHAQSVFNDHRPPFLIVYDALYYGSWARRTSRFAGQLHENYPWLEDLCEAFESRAREMSDTHTALIHGEYYSKNILTTSAGIYPVDWESAAVAPGEIDLATLVEGYDEATTEKCTNEYKRARWPSAGDRPTDFDRALDRARLYVAFRWLGDRPSWTIAPDNRWRFDALAAIGVRLGLIAI